MKRRRVEFISPEKETSTSCKTSSRDEDTIDWSKCFYCQGFSSDKLQCPFNNPLNKNDHDTIKRAYNELAEKILYIKDIGKLPKSVDIDALINDNDNLGLSLYKNAASIHKVCRNTVHMMQIRNKQQEPKEMETQKCETPNQPRKGN